jgi:hypothetical protein
MIFACNRKSVAFLVVLLLTPKRKSKRSVEQLMKRTLRARKIETTRLL